MDHYDAVYEDFEVRTVVQRFAKLMEKELRTNDARYGGNSWQRGTTVDGLLVYLENDMNKLVGAYHDGNRDKVIEQCADVANICMMIADVLKGLPDDPAPNS